MLKRRILSKRKLFSKSRSPRMTAEKAQTSAASMTWTNAEPDMLMMLAPANLRRSYQPVVSNKGASGAMK